MESLLRMEFKVIHPQSSAGAGARTESLGKLKEEQLKVAPKGAWHRDDASHRATEGRPKGRDERDRASQIERVFTNGERLRRRISSSVLFVFIC